MPTVETNGIETYYERHGEGPPVVLSHGGGWDHRSWMGQVEALSDDYEVVVYDVRGHGRSGSSDEDYTMDTYAADLKALVDALELDSPVVGGLSLGGMIAHTYAATYPDDCAGLIAAEAMVEFDLSRTERLVGTAMKYVMRVVGPARARTLRTWIAKLRGNVEDDDGDEPMPGLDVTVEEYMDEVAAAMGSEESLKMSAAVETLDGDPEAIDVPTLVVTGEDPNDAIAAGAAAMEEAIDDVRVEVVEDAGHGVNLEEPEAFNEALGAFLEDVVPPRADASD